MSKQYNVNIVGSLTNNNGVISGFVTKVNYLTLFDNFAPTSSSAWEIVIKFNLETVATTSLFRNLKSSTLNGGAYPYYDIEVEGDKLGLYFGNGDTWTGGDLLGVTSLQANTDYWVKVTYNGVSTYTILLSTDGVNYSTEQTGTHTAPTIPSSGVISTLGCVYGLDGLIDLNESYIKINNTYFWRGVSNVTHIQLRHDTSGNWSTVNSVLLQGEVGLELDTGKSKIGDGSTAWNSLAYDLASTALQSITSSNVTTALGYTPVNKTGDTMTGGLTVQNDYIVVQSTDSWSSTPSTQLEEGVNFYNSNGDRLGYINCVYTTDGSRLARLNTRNADGSANTYIQVGYNPQGNAYCTFPDTTCVDGQWVATNTQIASDVSVNGSTNLTYTLSDLPNDGNKYEVLLTGQVYTSNTSGNQARIQLSSDIVSTVYMCAAVTRVTQSAIAFGSVIIPVGNRQITVARNTGWNGTFNLYIRGYRRIGSNS